MSKIKHKIATRKFDKYENQNKVWCQGAHHTRKIIFFVTPRYKNMHLVEEFGLFVIKRAKTAQFIYKSIANVNIVQKRSVKHYKHGKNGWEMY